MVFIKQLPELTNVIESVNSTIGDGIDTDTLKDQFIDELSESIKTLSGEQATLALSTTNLTSEQQKLVLQQAGLISEEAELTATNGVLTASNLKLGTSFKLVGKAALASIKAMLTNPLTWILIGVPIAIKLLDKLIVTQKELAESVDSLMEEYNNALSKASSYRDTIEELIPVYEKLSNGVNGLGQNVSLTEEEFNEYNKTVNKIAEMFPDMVNGWTDEGNAIIDLKGNVELLRDAYREAQQEAYNLLISTGKDANGNDILKQFKNNFKNHVDLGTPDAGGQVTKYDAIQYLNEFANMSLKDTLGIMYRRVTKQNQYGQTHNYVVGDYLKKELGLSNNYSKDELIAAQKLARVKAQEYQSEVNSQLSNVKSLATAYMMTNDDFNNLSSNVQNGLSRVINSIDVDTAIGFKAKEDVGVYVNNMIASLKDNPDAQAALVQLFTLDTSEMTIADAQAQLQDYINIIAEAIGEDPIELRVKLGFEDQSQLISNYNAVMKKAADKFGSYQTHGGIRTYDYSWYEDFAKENSINTQSEVAFWNQCVDESKTKEDAAKKYLHESKEYLSTVGFTGFTEEQSKQIDDFQSKIGSLGSTLQSLRNGEEINMTDLIQEFPELAGQTEDLDNAITKLINDSLTQLINKLDGILPPEVIENLKSYTDQMTGLYPKLTDAYSGMHNIYDVMQQVKEEFDETTGIDKFTDSTLQSIAGINEHMNSMVAAWHANGVSSQELFDALKEEYQKDLENYGQALVKKYNESESFYESVGMTDAELIKQFNKDYEVDIDNCKTYNNAKMNIYNQTIGALTDNLKKFYDAEADGVSAELKRLEAAAASMDERTRYRFLQSNGYYEFMASYEKYTSAVEGLNKNIYKGIDATFSSVSKGLKDNADAASKAASEYNELFDFFERRIEVINQELSKLDGNLENVNGSLAKNMLVAGKIGIVSEEINDYTSALSMYQEKANAELAKLNSDLQDKIKNGAVNITQLIGESGEEVNNILTSYQNWANKVNECNQQLIELKETLRDLALDKFNNIAQEYTDRFDLIGSSKSIIEKQISLFEEAGEVVGKAFYESQIEATLKQRKALEEEKTALINELSSSISNGYIQKGTDEWLEMVKSIQSVDESILDCDQSVEQLQNSILALDDQAFERLQNQFSDIASQLSNIAGMLDEIDVSSEDGIWSDEGLTRLGMAAQQYELSRYNVEKYQEQIDSLNESYGQGLYSTTEYLEKLSDLTEAQWNEANAAEDAKKNIIDLNKARVDIIKNGIQKQIDAYKELTDAAKEALDKEKDLHVYEKSIAEKNKNIQKIQNQLNALANDDSAAANAKRIKLQQELADAREDLEEAQYDHSIEQQKEALDKQMEDFEEERQKEIDALEEYLKDTETVFKDSLTVIKENTEIISDQISKVVEKHGVEVSEVITEAWKSGEDAIASYGSKLSSSEFVGKLKGVEKYLKNLTTSANETATTLSNMFMVKSDNLVDEFNKAVSAESELVTATNMLNEAFIKMLGGGYDISGIIGQLTTVSEKADETARNVKKAFDDKENDNKTNNTTLESPKTEDNYTYSQQPTSRTTAYEVTPVYSGSEPMTSDLSDKTKQKNAQLEEAKRKYDKKIEELDRGLDELNAAARRGDSSANIELNRRKQARIDAQKAYEKEVESIKDRFRGFATGVYNLKHDEFAWTQEPGNELILSPTRNAVFTKLNKGDTVLTKEQTDNIFKFSKISPEEIFGRFKMASIGKSMQPVLTIGNVVTVNGNIDDTNIQKMQAVATSAVDKAFKKFSDEILKR